MKRTLIAALLLVSLLATLLPSAAASSGSFDVVDGVLISYRGPGGAITIPDGVRVISSDAFNTSPRTVLTSVFMPDSVTTIEDSAFALQGKLVSVRFSQNLKTIGYNAFYECAKLQNPALPHGLLTIYDEAFSGTSFTAFAVPATVTRVGNSFVYPVNWKWPQIGDFQVVGDGVAIGYTGTSADVVVPEGIKYFNEEAFAHHPDSTKIFSSEIKSISFPASMREIQENSLSSLNALERVTMAPGVEIIEDAFLSGSVVITHLEIPSTVQRATLPVLTKDGSLQPWTAAYRRGDFIIAGDGVLLGYTGSADEVTVPDGIKTIGGFRLSGDGPASITLPPSVTRLGLGAFRGCKALEDINLPNRLSAIESNAFSACQNLTSMVIPAGVTALGSWAFYDCARLREIYLPSTLERIENNAFYDCRSLTQISLPGSLRYLGRAAFGGCYGLSNLVLPAGLQTVERAALNGAALKTLTILGKDTDFKWDSLVVAVVLSDGTYQIESTPPIYYAPADARVRGYLASIGLPCNDLPTAVPSPSKVVIDGTPVTFDAYAIDGNNYMKLRDLAMVFQDTRSCFSVGWDGTSGTVDVQTHVGPGGYTPVGGELSPGDGLSKSAYRSGSLLRVNGSLLDLTAYVIGGNNYVKLRDIAAAADFSVKYDGATGTITIDTQ